MATIDKVRVAVRAGLDKVASSTPIKTGIDPDLDLYKRMKGIRFNGMLERYGRVPTLRYISTMEKKLRERGE